jgi:fructose-1,6-bisphosphatase I
MSGCSVTSWRTWPNGGGGPSTFHFDIFGAHIRHGYHDNPYEIEARAAEADRTRQERSMTSRSVVTIDRHIIDQERMHPEATGALSDILRHMALSAKLIAREVNKAGLVDILGATGDENVHGEQVKKLDEFADDVIFAAFDHTGLLCCMASEENEDILHIPERFPTGKYALVYDPLDGSANIDANVSIGTIFSVLRKRSDEPRGCQDDCLQMGRDQVAAGYVVYGSSTMLVYTTGNGVHGFTLDPSMDHLKGVDGENGEAVLVALHRLHGGRHAPDPAVWRSVHVPRGLEEPAGKLRLLYEGNPMAMVVEQAGGTGHGRPPGAPRYRAPQPAPAHAGLHGIEGVRGPGGALRSSGGGGRDRLAGR